MKDYNLQVQTLCIEVTRRCNMNCAHCMRGDAQNKDLDPSTLKPLFSAINTVDDLTPTGGEPSLNVRGLNQITDAIVDNGVSVQGIYLVTNGKEITRDFVEAFGEMLMATEMEEEACGLALSQDMFHDKIPLRNKRLLQLFACYRDDDKKTDWTKVPPAEIGRAAEMTVVNTRPPCRTTTLYAEAYDDSTIIIDSLAMTVDGYLLPCGDYSYEEVEDLAVCNVKDPNWKQTLLKELFRANPELETELSIVS